MKNRIDKELLERKLVPSRAKAQELLQDGKVICNDKVITKANYQVSSDDKITVLYSEKLKYVSRAGLKLEKAINEFGINLNGLVVMDVGSSTGGFCDCALKHGAKKVIAIDVGTNLLHDSLRTNQKVELHEKTNFRTLKHEYFKSVNFITCDVSFISLKKIIDKLFDEKIKIEGVFLIKPQFECGKEIADKYKGVILNKAIHKNILNDLISYFKGHGFRVLNLTSSPIRGGDGNVEYVIYVSNKNDHSKKIDVNGVVSSAMKK